LEAMAVGAAVVLCDQAGAGPMVTAEGFDRLRPLNFGIRTLREPVAPDVLEREIRRYDPADAAEVSRRVRAQAGLEAAVDRLVALYEQAVSEHRDREPAPAGAEGRAAAAYLRWLDPHLQARSLAGEMGRLTWELGRMAGELTRLTAKEERLNRLNESLRQDVTALETTVATVQRTLTWRLRERLVRMPPLLKLYRSLRR
ncbi:MAG: hypothetical protein WAM82_02190, partial [Thermoanaerobaculia bacterium]